MSPNKEIEELIQPKPITETIRKHPSFMLYHSGKKHHNTENLGSEKLRRYSQKRGVQKAKQYFYKNSKRVNKVALVKQYRRKRSYVTVE